MRNSFPLISGDILQDSQDVVIVVRVLLWFVVNSTLLRWLIASQKYNNILNQDYSFCGTQEGGLCNGPFARWTVCDILVDSTINYVRQKVP